MFCVFCEVYCELQDSTVLFNYEYCYVEPLLYTSTLLLGVVFN